MIKNQKKIIEILFIIYDFVYFSKFLVRILYLSGSHNLNIVCEILNYLISKYIFKSKVSKLIGSLIHSKIRSLWLLKNCKS